MLNMRRVLGALLALVLLAPWGVLRAGPGVTDSEIVIGQSLGLTRPLAALAPELVNISKTYLEGINAQGGIHGRRIRVVTEDDGYRPENTVRLVGKMIEQDQVFALMNLTGTANVGAILPLLAKENPPVPLISPFTGADLLREPPINHVFNVRASYGDEVEKLVQHLTTLGVPRISVLWMNNGFGKDGLAGARKSMEKRGLKLHSDAPIQADSSDVQQAVQSLSAGEPDAIIMITAGPRWCRCGGDIGCAISVEPQPAGRPGIPRCAEEGRHGGIRFLHWPGGVYQCQGAGRRLAPRWERPDTASLHPGHGVLAAL